MATELDTLLVKIKADISGLKKGLDRANSQVSKSSRKMSSNMNQFGKSLDRVGKRVLQFGSLFAVAFGGYQLKKVLDAGRVVEDLQVRLKALFGSAEEGAKSFQVMLEYAGKVPFSLGEIQKGSGNLAVVAKDAEELKEILFLTGNVAATTGLDFRQTAEQIQRSFSSGIASADVFRERGVGSLLGFQKGAEVSVAETIKVFKEAFGKGGKFGNVTKDLATTLTGTLSMLGDKLLQFRLAISESFTAEIKTQLSGMNKALQKSSKEIEIIGKAIGEKLAGAVSLFAENIDVIIRGLTALAIFLTGAMGVAIVGFIAGLGSIGLLIGAITVAYVGWGDEIQASYGWLYDQMKSLVVVSDSLEKTEGEVITLTDALKKMQELSPHKWWSGLSEALGLNKTKLAEVNEAIKIVIVTEEQLKEINQDLTKVFDDMGKDVSKAFGSAVVSGSSFRDAMRSILVSVSEQIVATISQILIIEPLIRRLTNSLKAYKNEMSVSVGGGGGILDTLVRVGISAFAGGGFGAGTPQIAGGSPTGSIVAGGGGTLGYGSYIQQQPMSYGGLANPAGYTPRASGGFVSPNMPYMVGEKGAEMFMPKSAGTIIPNDKMGAGGVTINQSLNFSTGVVPTVRAEVRNLMPQIKKETVSAVAEAKSRGGAFARTFGS
tara:strand:+ start:4512 stop:6491 length:1980 start_codon:yes stop_codon:yes gene_type:complete